MTVVFRRKGEKHEFTFSGSVYVLDEETGYNLIHVSREELATDRLDLCHIPVITIGGKKKRQGSRAQDFLASNPTFQGALILLPGSGNWDLDDGDLVFTSREVMDPNHRVSGGRPEVQLTNFRFLRDGRYVADRAKMLHGKVLETLETEIEQDVPMELLVRALSDRFSYSFRHPFQEKCGEVWTELYEIEKRRVLDEGGAERNIGEFISQYLTRNFEALEVKRVADVPSNFVITAELVMPELVVLRDNFGKVQIPGLGWKPVVELNFNERNIHFVKIRAAVELSAEELKQITEWPFNDLVIRVAGIESVNWYYSDPLFQQGENRWQQILEKICTRWLEVQKAANYPKEISVNDPKDVDPPVTPEPLVWGHGLIDGQVYTTFAALHHSVTFGKGRSSDRGWSIRWFDKQEEAEKCDAMARGEVYTFTYTRNLLAQLAAETQPADLPVEIPVYVKQEPNVENVASKLGLTPEQYEGITTIPELLNQAYRLGVSIDTIHAMHRYLEAYQQELEQAHRTAVGQFAKSLTAEPAFSCLSFETQEELTELAERTFGTPDLSKLGEKLAVEWPQAVHLHNLQSQGQILLNWGGHFRVMGNSGHSQYWVIGAEGKFRSHTDIDYRKAYTSEGNKYWRIVGPEELALTWSGSISVTVVHRPAEVTGAQRQAVAELETRQGFPAGLFGFDDEIKRRNAERLDAIHQVLNQRLGRIPLQGEYQGAEPYEFVDYEKGVNVGEPSEHIMRRVNQTAEPMYHFDRRGAYLVDSAPAAGGVVEFFVYHKYGYWNLGIRWRELSKEDNAPPPAPIPAKIEAPVPVVVEQAVQEAPAGSFTEAGNRYFRCGSCGRMERMAKADWKDYQSSMEKTLTCEGCGKTAQVKK
ncbi:MAG: hypothetical protein Q8R13_06265 [bacterium]|nr:hypothetical protein [bacterium]